MVTQHCVHAKLGTQPGRQVDMSLSRHLLRILTACVRVLPDSMVKQLVANTISTDILLTMANHEDDGIRAGVITLIGAVLTRNEEDKQKFLKNHGFVLLANQLQPYVATAVVVESCLSIYMGVDVNMDQLHDLVLWPDSVSTLQLHSLVLLLTLLPNSAVDPALFSNLVAMLRTLCSGSSVLLRFLLDFGMIESIGKTIVALGHTSACDMDILEQRQDDLLMEDVQRLLIIVTTKCVTCSGIKNHLLNMSVDC